MTYARLDLHILRQVRVDRQAEARIVNSVMINHLLQPLVCERFLTEARYREGHLRVVNALPKMDFAKKLLPLRPFIKKLQL